MGHFPLHHFWGPLANLKSTAWIVDSAVRVAGWERPNFFYIYLPHLDYAAQRTGPDSTAAQVAVADLDRLIGKLGPEFREAYDAQPLWLAAGEYAIVPVSHVVYPNRVLREAGLLSIREGDDGEYLDPAASRAWALADHQFSHVFVAGGNREVIARAVDLFHNRPGIAEVLVGDERRRYGLDHPRSGEVVLISTPESWQAYYYWLRDDRRRPGPGRWISIASRATTRRSSASIRPQKAPRCMPSWSPVPTERPRWTPARRPFCWLRSPGCFRRGL